MLPLNPSSRPRLKRSSLALTASALLFLTALSGCGEIDQPEFFETHPEEYDTFRQSLGEFCSVDLQGVGTLSVEDQYLAQVVACENNNAPMESLKAQAIAARTYAMFISKVERRSLATDQNDQAYVCNNQVQQRHIDAVRATEGQVLTHNGRLTAAFYVAGARPQSANGCQAASGDSDWSNTERFVTYNQGRIGSNVRTSPLGHSGNPANRGAKSQEGANCLADQGWDHQRILRFYYGDDIRITSLEGSCYASSDPGAAGPALQNDAPTCQEADQHPHIVERSEWGALAPRRGSGRHTPNRLSIHHTVTDHNASNPAQAVRDIQRSHRNRQTSNGTYWADIGYHFVIDHDGTIYRGRAENHVGAHVPAANTGNLGIALIGRYHLSTPPPEVQLRSAAGLIRYLSDKYDIAINRDRIKGHREQSATQCPGDQIMNRFDSLLEDAAADALCEEPERDLKGPEIETEESSASYRYVRIRGLSLEPLGVDGDAVPGFEVDAVAVEPQGEGLIYASQISSSSGVSGASRALGAPDNTSCEDRTSTVAGVSEGGTLVLDMGQNFGPGAMVHVIQHSYLPADAFCTPSGTAEVSVSADGQNWEILSDEVVGNWRQTLTGPTIRFAEPGSGARVSPTVRLRARTTGPIARVEYYAEHYELGESSNREDRFFVEREFNVFGRRLLTAVGYDANNRPVAMDSILVDVIDGFSFLSPRDGAWASADMELKVAAANEEITRVTYEADGFPIDESQDRASDFAVRYEFNTFGERNLIARGFNNQGQEIAADQITVELHPEAAKLEFISPQPGGWYTPEVSFRVDFDDEIDSLIARVEYYAEEWLLGESSNRDGAFPLSYEFSTFGERQIRAVAYDADGEVLVERRIRILITDENGSLPEGSLTGGNSSLSGSVDSARADVLAEEAGRCSASASSPALAARCTDGAGGWSTGEAWSFVWAAMLRADLTTSAAADRLANAGPCSAGIFNLSAYGFRCNADANPSILLTTFGMERLDVPVAEAPRGALISWDRGCLGYSQEHGHIEISTGNAQACSDFCAPIRGNANCASVYIPVQ